MKNVLLFAGLLLTITVSCKHSDVEPARSIEGTYQAKDYDHFSSFGNSIAYPINGQELTLQIKYITADTVSVQIIPTGTTNSLPNGVYSPTQTLSYPKAYVESPNNTATYIYLMGKSGGTVSTTNPQIWIYSDKNTADYLFTPAQTPAFSKSIRFQKN
ncbi:hypothetical protein ACFSUS_13030 [Spirosoma soli]|uniref:Uncharacterized protein n=1 Tax=Spirosoma soli TaxID=1770529 RepID=A0ABW5M4W8_9BACT